MPTLYSPTTGTHWVVTEMPSAERWPTFGWPADTKVIDDSPDPTSPHWRWDNRTQSWSEDMAASRAARRRWMTMRRERGIRGAGMDGLVPKHEARAWLARGELPIAVDNALAAMTEDDALEALEALRRPVWHRLDPAFKVFADAVGATEPQRDAFFERWGDVG